MARRKTKFQLGWLKDGETDENGDELSSYIVPDKNDQHYATCTACGKSINISNMGKAAIKVHATRDSHKELIRIKKGKSQQRKLTFQSVDNVNKDDGPSTSNQGEEASEEVIVLDQEKRGESKKKTDFTISVSKDPTKLTERLSTQGYITVEHFLCIIC